MHIKAIWNYTSKGLLAILGVLIVFSLASIIFLVTTLIQVNERLTRGSGAVGATIVLQDLTLNLRALESGPRAYVATGNMVFLENFDEAIGRVERDVQLIKTDERLFITSAEASRIERLVVRKVSFSRRVVQTYDRDGREAAAALVGTAEGRNLMRRLETEITDIATVNLRDIGPEQQRSQDSVRSALVVAVTLAALVLGASLAIIRHFQRAILRERALENTKSEFLSLASHQLRTPATNVKQYIGLLLDGYMGELTEQQRHALTVAYRNNESEITIMNNLLDVAKLDLNRIQLSKKPANVTNIARHVVTDYKKIARERDQTIRLIGDQQAMALIDSGYIRGVIENLVDNALKYSYENTVVTVRVVQEGDEVVISVKDRGLGIRKRDHARLFNKFTRLANDFSANSQGSGLGLYWVKQIVRLHGGRIIVVSREGKGSTFTVRLPVR